MSKRTRFGIVFEGPAPDLGAGFLKRLNITDAEGCAQDGVQYVLLRTGKPRASIDVAECAAEHALKLIRFQPSEPEVMVFEKGSKFRVHPMGRFIHSMRRDASYWRWPDGQPRRKKRVAAELQSDLVETTIVPASTKRVAIKVMIGGWAASVFLPSRTRGLIRARGQTGTYAIPSGTTERPSTMAARTKRTSCIRTMGPSVDMIAMLVNEVTRSKDETIRCKDQMIQLLMGVKKDACDE